MAEIRQFQTETKRLLDLMVNSIYTNREIFLRELISNASDAIDKHHYLSLTTKDIEKVDDYKIFLEVDKKKRTLTITDNGLGMNYDDLVSSLGTIAKSGSLEFLENIKKSKNKNEVEIIGQFGVGFYSSYMVSDLVEVYTRKYDEDKGYLFSSKGTDTYEISEVEGLNTGTKIILHLRKNTKEDNYDEFLEEYKLRNLVEKYSDYIRYPIQMEITKSIPKKDKEGNEVEDKFIDILEVETLNSMTPLWRKNKNDVTDEELNDFYKQKYYDYEDPLETIFFNVEGKVNYTALIYIPKKAPHNLYSEKFEKGLQLYSKSVFIMDKCKELVPDYLRFIKGLVDSNDLSLNISREILQKNKDLEAIASNVEKKIIGRLELMMKNERDKYIEFFKAYGINFKFGIYDNFGLKKDDLQDLLLYKTIKDDSYISLREYVDAMPEGQDHIYFASGKTKEQVLALPQMDLVKKQGYNVLVLVDEVDEFVLQVMRDYDKKEFKSINQGELDLLDEKEKEKIEQLAEDKKSLLERLKEVLKDEVSDVVLSKRLTDSPVCLVSEDGLSFEMEKYIATLPSEEKVKATKVLEINPNHALFKTIEKLFNDNDDDLADYAKLLYSQALLIEGFKLDDPVEFSNKMTELMIKASK